MRILFSWLKEFLELSLPPEALAERLTMGGAEVTSLTRVDDDWLFELEITPNRPDLLSHLGIAREAAAVLGRPFRFPRWLKRDLVVPQGEPPPISVAIEDSQGCRRYVGIVIEGIEVRPSPPALARRLTRCGLRPVNNVVDVTNLCLLELGQPLHAFDLDRLEGNKVSVRRAAPWERLVALDGLSHTLTPEILVIADARGPIALAGVMGGKESEIHGRTRRILLEAAWFDPARIHRAARLLKVSSESSYQFERGIDPAMIPMAASRAAQWICRLAGGFLQGGLIDVGQTQQVGRSISLRPRHVQALLGMRIYPAQQRRLLERLGCRLTGTTRSWRVEPPSWRADLKISEDLYEELARVWGYDRCPETLPPVARAEVSPNWKPLEESQIAQEMEIRRLLASSRMQEIQTYSLISLDLLARCQIIEKNPVTLQNPLSSEQAILRPHLLPGALEVVARNAHRKSASAFQLFELGRVYRHNGESRSKENAPSEERALSLLVAGTPEPTWGVHEKQLDIFQIKGIVQFLVERLRIGPLTETIVNTGPPYFIGPALSFWIGEHLLGTAGLIDPKILTSFELPEVVPVAYAQLDVERLISTQAIPLRIQGLSKVLPPVSRDVAIVVSDQIPHEAIHRTIEEAGEPLLEKIVLFDLYKGKQVPSGKKSFAFRLSFSAGDRTLTDEKVASSHKKIVEALKANHQALLR